MNAEIPQNLEDLVKREHALKKRIGQRSSLAEKIHSGYTIQPVSPNERIRRQRAFVIEMQVQHSIGETQLKLDEISARVDEGAVELALSYEKEGASISHQFKRLMGTLERTSQPNLPEDFIAQAQTSMTEINQKPLSDPILQRGLYLLDEQRQEAKIVPTSDDVKKEEARKKGTYDRKNYTVTMPDGVEIKINGSVRNKMIQALVQAYSEKRALTAKELTMMVYGDNDQNHVDSMQLTLVHLRPIFEKSGWKVNQLITHPELRQGFPVLYLLEKIQEPKKITPPPAPEQPEKREAIIPMRGFVALKGLLFNPDFTPDEAIEILGTDKNSKPLTPWRAFWSIGNTLKGIISRINRNDANITTDEREIYEGFRAVTTSTIDHDAWGEYMGMVKNWFGIKQDGSGRQPAIEGEQEEIEVTPETLTKDEAILLASRILYFNGVEIKSRDGNLILKAEIDEITLESASRVRDQITDQDYFSMETNQRREIRKQALQKVKKIMEDDTLLESIYESQTSEDVQTLLCWLILENEHYAGELINFMDLPTGLVTSFDGHNLWVEGVQSQIIVNSETAAKLLSAREQKEEKTPTTVVNPPAADKAPEGTEDTEDGDEAEDIDNNDDDLEEPAMEQSGQKRRKLGRREINSKDQGPIKQEIKRLADILVAANLPEITTEGVLIGKNIGFSSTDIQKARQDQWIEQEALGRYSKESMVILLFRRHNGWQQLRPNDVGRLKAIIREVLEVARKDK